MRECTLRIWLETLNRPEESNHATWLQVFLLLPSTADLHNAPLRDEGRALGVLCNYGPRGRPWLANLAKIRA